MKYSLLRFVRAQLTTTHAPALYDDLSGKVVMVVGANVGIGFEASKHFAKMNPAKLIMTARSKEKGEAAILRLAEETSCKAELRLIDLSDFSSVKAFLEDFERTESRLDILVMNAAVVMNAYSTTKDGWESTLQVNNLASSWVALRLLPLMQNTAKLHGSVPRLVIVASEVHYWSDLDKKIISTPSLYEKLSSKEHYEKQGVGMQYNHTKLINVFFTRALAGRMPNDPSQFVVVDCVTPGMCHSEIRRNLTGISGFFSGLIGKLLAFTGEEGSRQILYAALSGIDDPEQRKKLSGSFINLSYITEPSDFVISEEGKIVQEKFWTETIDILSKQDPTLRETEKRCLTAA